MPAGARPGAPRRSGHAPRTTLSCGGRLTPLRRAIRGSDATCPDVRRVPCQLANPTEWTRRTLRDAGLMQRGLRTVISHAGHGIGGAATFVQRRPDDATVLRGWIHSAVQPTLRAGRDVVAVHAWASAPGDPACVDRVRARPEPLSRRVATAHARVRAPVHSSSEGFGSSSRWCRSQRRPTSTNLQELALRFSNRPRTMLRGSRAATRGRPPRATPIVWSQGLRRSSSRGDKDGHRSSHTVPMMIVSTVSGAPTRK